MRRQTFTGKLPTDKPPHLENKSPCAVAPATGGRKSKQIFYDLQP